MGPIVMNYHVNTIGREFHWTRKDCLQMKTVRYNGLTYTNTHTHIDWGKLRIISRILEFSSRLIQKLMIFL